MNGDIFCDWLKHFINFVRPSLTQKVLLILDGHKSHTQNIEALEHALKSGVIMLSLPPHTTHKLQPLDVSFFKPLKTYYYQHLNQWMRAHPGRPVTMFQICQLFGKAYGQAATVGNAVNGFRKTGLFPVNPLVLMTVNLNLPMSQIGRIQQKMKISTLLVNLTVILLHLVKTCPLVSL